MAEIRNQVIKHVNKDFGRKNGSFNLKTHLKLLAADYFTQGFHN